MANVSDFMDRMFQSRGSRAVNDANELKLQEFMQMLRQRQGQEVAAGALMGAHNPDGSPRMFPGINRTEIQRSAPTMVPDFTTPSEGPNSLPITGARQVEMQAPQPMMDAPTRQGFEQTFAGGAAPLLQAQRAEAARRDAESKIVEWGKPGETRFEGGVPTYQLPFKPDEMTEWQKQQAANQDRQFGLAESRLAGVDARNTEAEARRNRPQPTAYVSRITGNPVFMDPQTQSYMDNGQAITANDLIAAPDFNKETEKARTVTGGTDRARSVMERVKANTSAFDTDRVNEARVKGYVPFSGKQLAAKVFTDEENKLRAEVNRESAAIINELYGAALSAGEQDRASTFAPSPDDTMEQLMPKLEAAISWGETQERALLPAAISRARSQMGKSQKTAAAQPPGPAPMGKNGKPMKWKPE